MSNATKRVPDGYHTVTPYLIVKNAADAIQFYQKAFGAKEIMRFAMPNGKIAHAEIQIGNSRIMLADEYIEMNAKSPEAYGGSPISMHLYVEDVDQLFEQAVAAGAKIERPIEDQFYGDRLGGLSDPFGHQWYISSRIENLTMEEMQRRSQAHKKEACN